MRLAYNPGTAYNQAADLIDVDNIIASYPVKTVEMHEYGTYDDTLEGVAVRGWTPAFTTAFPAVGEAGVKGRVALEYFGDFTIPAAYGVTKDLEIKKVKMNYRWRYLDQITNPWQTVEMRNTDDEGVNWETVEDLDLSDGIGDVEYNFEAELSSPYYLFGDYTGCELLGYPADWTERIQGVDRAADPEESFSLSLERESPAGGKDFFVRLREGVSQYELVQLVNTVTGLVDVVTNQEEVASGMADPLFETQPFVEVQTNNFELVGDHLWRGFMKTPTNHADYVDFHFLGLNCTENGATALADNATHWKPVEATIPSADLPYSGIVETVADPEGAEAGEFDSRVEIDASQGYLMFEFNDQFGTFTVTRADYQNFNLWTDARGLVFVGDASSGTTGVSRVKTAYEELFTNLNVKTSDSLSTNKFWVEDFKGAGNEANIQKNWTRNIPFVSKLSPNGWTCDYGEWASERFITNNLAFRMAGCGYGAISLQNLTEPMNGVDTFTFDARLSQYLGFDSFSYNETKTTDKNYGVSAGVAMSTNSGNDMSPETPSISMVAYYRPNEGCYEFRATRYDKWVVKLELYKWVKEGYEVKSRLLVGTNITERAFGDGTTGKTAVSNWLQNASFPAPMELYGMYMWVTNETATGRAVICAGIARDKKSVKAPSIEKFFGYTKSDTDVGSTQNTFFQLTCTDDTNPLRRGAYGVGANDCRARFNLLSRHSMASGFSPSIIESEISEFTYGNWTPAIGRSELYTVSDYNFGITNIVAPQAVEILFAPASEGATEISNVRWSDSVDYTVTPSSDVTDFQNKTYTVTVHSTSNFFPRLQHGASAYGPRTDIVVDNLEIKGYRGVPATEWSESSINQWVWTETWLARSGKTLRCNFWPARANPTYPLSLRSPLLNGISMLSFRYEDAKPGVRLLVQIWTNDMEHAASDLVKMTRAVSDANWKTWETIDFTGDPSIGSHTTYFSLRAPIKGMVRLIMDPAIVTAAANGDSVSEAKTITITSITVWDEPELDEYSWTGWNMLTTDASDKAYLPDPATVPSGLSGALNHKLDQNVKSSNPQVDYGYHNPYVQSPLAEGGIGQVSFKARKYTTGQADATVSILGASNPSAPDTEWVTLTNIVVDSKSYKTYTWTISGDSSPYKSVRFSVDGVAQTNSVPPYRLNPQRVLLEEMTVSEPIAPRVRFSAAMPFRSGLFEKGAVANLLEPDQQPLVGENFGFQVELKLSQLADELDADSVVVNVAYYHGSSPWGWRNWIERPDAVKLTLPAAEGTNLLYRSTYDSAASIVPPFEQEASGTLNVVQYHAWVTYRKKGDDPSVEPNRHDLTEGEWTIGKSSEGAYSFPSWYWPLNLNESLGGGQEKNFSAYTVLDTVSPYRAWINEFNIFDGESDLVPTNQFVEIALPVGADLTGWYVQAQDMYGDKQTLFVFGENKVAGSKYVDATNHFAFISVASPETYKKMGESSFDGKWSSTFPRAGDAGGRFNYFEPYALELVRPSEIVEQQIVVAGTNIYLTEYTDYEYWFSGTNLMAEIARTERPGYKWTYNGADMTRGTIGAMATHGEGGLVTDGGTWEIDLMPTSGKVNKRWDGTVEDIDEDWFVEANGTNVWVYATVVSDHLAQKSGIYTNKAFRIVLPHGITTNITYEADDWWRIAYVNMNGVGVPEAVGKKKFDLVLSDLTTNVDVVAAAMPAGSVTNGTGFVGDPTNIYTTAVLDWLGGFPEIDDDGKTNEIKLAWFYNPEGTIRHRQLTLTEMYWLDITPIQQCQLWAGMKDGVWGRCPEPVMYYDSDGANLRPMTNIRVTVSMLITNLETKTAWAPYRMQTVDGLRSDEYDGVNWPGVTFKIEAQLPVVATNRWVALRHFIFKDGSFKNSPGAADDHCARIEVRDPFDTGSAAFEAGWSRYRFTDTPLLRWNIDSSPSRATLPVDVLKPDSTY